MNKKNILTRSLLYISIATVIYYLISFDYLVFRNIYINWKYLIISLFILFAGFFVSGLSWQNSLKCHGIDISIVSAIESHGFSVFTKYLPGKIWVILGRASLVSKNDDELATLSAISLKEQLVFLLVGLLLGALLLYFIPHNYLIESVLFFTIILLSLFLFSKNVHLYFLLIINSISKKNINLPFIGIKGILRFIPYILTYWILWGISFLFLCKTIVPEARFSTVFVFPLASCYGLLAFFVPGGIGVREGIIVLLLTKMGISLEQATTISAIQRIWFICGETFIFLLAFILKNTNTE